MHWWSMCAIQKYLGMGALWQVKHIKSSLTKLIAIMFMPNLYIKKSVKSFNLTLFYGCGDTQQAMSTKNRGHAKGVTANGCGDRI